MQTLAELFRRLTPGTRLTVDGPFFKEGRDRRPGIRTVHKCTRFYLVLRKANGDKSSLQWPRKKDIDLLPDGWTVKEDGKVLLRYTFAPPLPAFDPDGQDSWAPLQREIDPDGQG